MHAGAGLGDDARLAHTPSQHDLAEHIIHLVCAGVIELLALEIDFRAAAMLREPLGEIKRRRPSDVGCEMAVHLCLERWIGLGLSIGALQIEDQRHQRLGDVAAAIEAEMAALVRPGAIGVERRLIENSAHEANAFCSGRAALAAWMNARTRASSFSPGARSTPDDTSTMSAPVVTKASQTLSGSSPPDSAKGRSARRPPRACQSKASPWPPGTLEPAGAFASNRIISAMPRSPRRGPASRCHEAAAGSGGP